MERKTKGRQKIPMARMKNENHLQVTFSKRRASLFKKASELSILCGAEVGVIVFSPGNKAYSFGHPSVDAIIDRFLNGNVPNFDAYPSLEARRDANVRHLNLRLTHVQSMLEVQKQHGEALDEIRAKSQCERWWEAPTEQQNLQQLEQLKAAMEELKDNVTKQVEKLMQEQTSNLFPFSTNPVSFGEGGDILPLFMPSGDGSSTLIGEASSSIGGSGTVCQQFPQWQSCTTFPGGSSSSGGGSGTIFQFPQLPSSSTFPKGPSSFEGGSGVSQFPHYWSSSSSSRYGGGTVSKFSQWPSSSTFPEGPNSFGGGRGVSQFSPWPSSYGGGCYGASGVSQFSTSSDSIGGGWSFLGGLSSSGGGDSNGGNGSSGSPFEG